MKINQVLMESSGATVAFAFGRFNPAHQGHIEVWRAVEQAGANWFIGTNPNTIGPDDPLTFEQKSAWMEEIYPAIAGHIVAQTSVLTLAAYIFKKTRKNERATVAYITDATDWAWSGKLLNQYNGVEGAHGYYKFAEIVHIPSPRVTSASELRKAARVNDRVAFYDASGTDPKSTVDGLTYFDTVKQAVEKYPLPVKRGQKVKEQGVAEGADFDRCFDQACKLYDRAVSKNLEPKLVQVADFRGDGNGADPRWLKLPQHVWQHYVVIVGDQVLDPTAKQFGDSMPTQYQVLDLDRLWGKQYQIRPRQGVAENQGDSLKFDALEKLIAIKQQIQQEIQQKQEADIAAWKQDFEKNTVQKAKQQLSTTLQKTPVAQAGEKYNALKDRLVQLNVAILKHKELINLIDTIKKEYPVIADRVDSYYESILPYVRDGAKDNYKSLITKLNSIDRDLRTSYPRAVKEGSLTEMASKLLSAEDRNGVITVVVQAPDGTRRSLADENPRYINQWLMKYDLQLPPNITSKFKQFSLTEFAPSDDSHSDEKSYLLQLADDLFQAIYVARNKMAVKAVKEKIAATGGNVKIVWNNNGSFNVVMYHPVHFKQGHLVSLVGDSDSQRMGESTNVQGPVEAWGYRYNERDQRVMWRLNFDSEAAARKWADSKNATVLEIRPVKQLEEDEQKTVAKTWDQMTPQEKSSGVKGRTLWNEKTQRYYTVFDVPVNNKEVDEDASLATMRNYFAGDKSPHNPSAKDKRFRSPAEYEAWLKQNKLKQISGVSEDEEVDEANLSAMRDFFAKDNDDQNSKDIQTTDKRFRSPEEYEAWLAQNKLKKVAGPAVPPNDRIHQLQGPQTKK